MTYKELKNKLPKGWHEVTLQTYQRVMKQEYYFELEEGDDEYALQQIDNSLLTISALMNVDVTILRGYKINEYMELIKLTQWVSKLPEPSKIKPTYIKESIAITLDNYLAYQALASTPSKAIENIMGVMSLFVKASTPIKKRWFRKAAINVPDVDSMNMNEVMTFFFFVQELLMKSLKLIQYKLMLQLMFQRMLQKIGFKPVHS